MTKTNNETLILFKVSLKEIKQELTEMLRFNIKPQITK